MKYIIITLVVLFIIALWIFYLCRRKWAIRKVNCDSDEEKLSYINAALDPFGFAFDPLQDIVISKNDSWQRDVGYRDLYDLKAPFLNMVMDAEPIYFDYDHKHYRIEFWKGQYGITTGAEIGVYVRDFDCKLPKGYYRCARDCERLNMCFMLFKKCFLFSREDLSWWLTGFDVGKFSKPKDLKLKACIYFPNKEMQVAFVEGLLNAGYEQNKIEVCCDYVCFDLCCPLNYKLNHCHRIMKCIAQCCNFINCSIFMHFTRFFNRTLDKLAYLRYMAPCLYRFIIRLSIPRRKQRKYCKKHHKHKK